MRKMAVVASRLSWRQEHVRIIRRVNYTLPHGKSLYDPPSESSLLLFVFFQRFLNLAVCPCERSKKSQSQRRYFEAGISRVLRQAAGRGEASHPPEIARRSAWGTDVKEWLYVRSQKR